MLQMNVAKVDQNVAYVAVVVHICCRGMFPMFYLCFGMYCCKCVLSGCYIRFTHMLQVFYPDIAYVATVFKCFHVFCKCFRSMFYLSSDVCCKCCI
jgi:hypothetical protein